MIDRTETTIYPSFNEYLYTIVYNFP